MATIDKLVKFLNTKNVASLLDEDKLHDIAEDVIKGYEIDEDSRKDWLELNDEAMSIMRNEDNRQDDNRLYDGQCKLVFPLLASANIQLASRLSTHITRNDKTVEMKVLGKDTPVMDPQSHQPIPGLFVKAEKARKVSEFMNYELLIESDCWLKDMQKLQSVVSSWGTGFAQVYYDFVDKKNKCDIIHPRNITVNQHVSSLDKAPRITVAHYLTKNEIIEQIRAGYFLDMELDELEVDPSDDNKNASDEEQPVYKILCQTCYIDLDGDEYLEPYKVYVNKQSKKVYCIVPAFEFQDIDVDKSGKINRIKKRLDVMDQHAIDDPNGGYYSIGLNYLLLHPNKALTAIQRALIDAGMLSNAAAVTGFVTKAFKTKERSIRVRLGEYPVLDCNPNVDASKQIIPMPFREPSQVLLNMFQILIDISKNNGFLNDILTGDVEMQNVPATTSLAFTEQATRAFKPLIENLYIFEKKVFKVWFHLHSKYLDDSTYMNVEDDPSAIAKSDFDEKSIDIVPVADPTLSSDAFKYGRCRVLAEGLQYFGAATNMQEAALRYYTDAGFPDAQKLVQMQQQAPDPKMLEVQLKGQIAAQQNQIDQMQLKLQAQSQQFEQTLKQQQFDLKSGQAHVKAIESGAKAKKSQADAVFSLGDINAKHRQIDLNQQKAMGDQIISQQKVDVEKAKVMVENKKADNMNKGDFNE